MADSKEPKMLGSFTQKALPEDNDLFIGWDAKESKVENFKFSGLWDYITNNLSSTVISKIETASKYVIGAINELNGKIPTVKASSVTATDKKLTFKITSNSASDMGMYVITGNASDTKLFTLIASFGGSWEKISCTGSGLATNFTCTVSNGTVTIAADEITSADSFTISCVKLVPAK